MSISDGLRGVVSSRMDPDIETAVRNLARVDSLTPSEWLHKLAKREIARRKMAMGGGDES